MTGISSNEIVLHRRAMPYLVRTHGVKMVTSWISSLLDVSDPETLASNDMASSTQMLRYTTCHKEAVAGSMIPVDDIPTGMLPGSAP